MAIAEIFSRSAAELALFAGAGFLLFGLNDLLVDFIYFTRRIRIFVGYYRNDPATAAAIASVRDERIRAVQVERDGPTTKADCLNHLYDALIAYELESGRSAKAVVMHDAEDVVHPYELRIFDGLIDRAAVIQLPVLPLPNPHSRWISGHFDYRQRLAGNALPGSGPAITLAADF